jgi:hypothetical protein
MTDRNDTRRSGDLDAMVAALRILEGLSTMDRDKLWFDIGRASMTLRLAIGSRADVPMRLVSKTEAK